MVDKLTAFYTNRISNHNIYTTMKKTFLIISAFCSLSMAMAQQNYEMGKPNDSNYDYLKDYSPLKEYIDYSKYPNFRLGLAIGANDYLNNATVRKVSNEYFTETVPGNCMKMGSVVNSNGDMNFDLVKRYVNAAYAAGLNVYGHTLAWHSQQPIGWLKSLLKDKPAEDLTSGDVKVGVEVSRKDFRTTQNVGWTADKTQYGFSLNFSNTDGLNIHTTKQVNSWEVQFVAFSDLGLTKGKTYKMKMMIKGSKAGKLHTKVGDWSTGKTADISFTTEWKEVEQTYASIPSSDFLLLQCGDFVGDIYIRTISFEEEKWAKNVTEDRRCLAIHATEKQSEVWDNQFWLVPGSFAANAKYELSMDIRADKAATTSTQIHNDPSNYVGNGIGNINFTTEWKTINLSGTLTSAGKSIAFNLSELADENTYYFDNISLKVNGIEKIKNGDLEGTDVSSFAAKEYSKGVEAPEIATSISYLYMPTSTPLTPQEQHDTLVYAMDKWIKGMMQACNGKVKAWDVVNEAISGGGNDGQGNYTLQHSSGYVPGATTWDVGGDAFYWQDYMGDLEYVRQAVRLARKYGPEDLKLFINDYNLESDWDSNKKVKSLINWIKKWEADGETKIDGIGTQMHISCYMNETTQANKKRAITNMFKLMAQTGKLVRVSEFDMGMVDANGKDVPTDQMTEVMHKRMANYYEWILKQYLTLIPADQQWGFCQWCATDSPSNSGWRANTPVGIWALNYAYRKHIYAGVVRGLGGVLTGLDEIEVNQPTTTEEVIFNLQGQRMQAEYDELPAGIYIVNGKKVMKK